MANPYGDPKEIVPYRALQVIILIIFMLGGGWLIGDGIDEPKEPSSSVEAVK